MNAFYCINDEKKFKFYGQFCNKPKFGTNDVWVKFEGKITIEINNDKIYA